MPASVAARPEPAVAHRPPDGVPSTGPEVEDLGVHAITGFPARGTRYTTVIPLADANAEPAIATVETWESTELQVVILTRTFDPRTGDRTIFLKNLTRSEPDPALFRVPAGFQTRDETGEFLIAFTVRY